VRHLKIDGRRITNDKAIDQYKKTAFEVNAVEYATVVVRYLKKKAEQSISLV
jgi:hypothetical protein